MNRMLIVLGAVLVVAGLLWPWLKKMHLSHLPGNIVIDRPGFKFFAPRPQVAGTNIPVSG